MSPREAHAHGLLPSGYRILDSYFPGMMSEIIPYGVSSLDMNYVHSARADVSYVFITDGTLPNPWTMLPPTSRR